MWKFVLLAFSAVTIVCGVDVEEDNNSTTQRKFITPCLTPNGDAGLCVDLPNCHLYKDQTITPDHEAHDFITASGCGPPSAKIFKICCGKYDNYISQNGALPEKNSNAQPEIEIPEDPLPVFCGRNLNVLANRIFGGKEAELGEFPWMARLVHRSKWGYRNFGCSGVLIHRRFVMTAAHCLSGKLVDAIGPVFQVLLGDHDTDVDIDCVDFNNMKYCSDPPVRIGAGKPVIHRGYVNSVNHNNDIALIPLKDPVTFTDYIQPICLSENPLNVNMYTLSGWGETETGYSTSKKLKVDVPKVDSDVCTNKYHTINVQIMAKNQICAGGEAGKDSCVGDSGGPLMANVDDRWYAEGIISFGPSGGCGRKDWPGVYTNVSRYVDWIRGTIRRKLENKKRKHGITY